MNYTINAGEHSANKDHTTMTGGTLSVDKTVKCKDWVTFYTYSIPFYSEWSFDTEFHKWVHAAEHMIAYKKDTGSVRNSLEEVSEGALSWKVILDISPYRTSVSTFGFRLTSMVPLGKEHVNDLIKISVERAIRFLEDWDIENPDDFQWIPFARPVSCGQYDFHNKQRAISDLKSINLDTLIIEEKVIHSQHPTAYVCDLRFLKPKTQWSNDMIMFSPEFSYKVSQLIETELPQKLHNSIALVWTFWCMTWMYLCISSQLGDESDISHIHATIISILKEKIDINSLENSEKNQYKTLIENYEKFSKK